MPLDAACLIMHQTPRMANSSGVWSNSAPAPVVVTLSASTP